MNNVGILVFGYDRPIHLSECLKSITKANENYSIPVHVVLDGACVEKTQVTNIECLKVIKNYQSHFKYIHLTRRSKNFGLRKNIIHACNEFFDYYDYIIVVEDDLKLSETTLDYFDWATTIFDKFELGQVSAFNYSDFSKMSADNGNNMEDGTTYLFTRPLSWGWMTSKRVWRSIDWEISPTRKDWKHINAVGGEDLSRMFAYNRRGLISSWYVVFCVNLILKKHLTLFPSQSLIYNQGHDGSGVHGSRKQKTSFSGGYSEFLRESVKNPVYNETFNKWMNGKFRFSWYARYIIPIRDLLNAFIKKIT